ncbi:MAG: hypothetical protein PHP50_06950 [Lachnospiraceae bacterium]|nr:hypothetical protein [Lachnospiraceae bacterium]
MADAGRNYDNLLVGVFLLSKFLGTPLVDADYVLLYAGTKEREAGERKRTIA